MQTLAGGLYVAKVPCSCIQPHILTPASHPPPGQSCLPQLASSDSDGNGMDRPGSPLSPVDIGMNVTSRITPHIHSATAALAMAVKASKLQVGLTPH